MFTPQTSSASISWLTRMYPSSVEIAVPDRPVRITAMVIGSSSLTVACAATAGTCGASPFGLISPSAATITKNPCDTAISRNTGSGSIAV